MIWVVVSLAVLTPDGALDAKAAAVLSRLSEARGLPSHPSVLVSEDGGTLRVTVQGSVITWPCDLDHCLPEGAMAFALAHEWAHVELGHLRRLRAAGVLGAVLGLGAGCPSTAPLRWEMEADMAALEWVLAAGYPGYVAFDALDTLALPSDWVWARRMALAQRLGE